MNSLAEYFRADPFEERVVWFREVRQANLPRLLERLLREYHLYSATDADGCDLFDEASDRDLSFLINRSSNYYWINFHGQSPPLYRPKFLLTPSEDTWFDVKLYFDLCDFPDPPPVEQLIATIQQFAAALDAKSYSVHHKLNTEWQAGDFSERTVIFSNSNVP